MKKLIVKAICVLLVVCMLAAYIVVPAEVNAVGEFYGSYTDVDKIADYSSCSSMQGLAVGSQKMYTVKINSDDTKAFISMTDKDTGETVKLYNSDASSYYFDYLGHANDMDVRSFDGKSHLFVATMEKGSNAIVRLERSGSNLTKVASYKLTHDGSSISASGIAITDVSGGIISFITKSGNNIYKGSVSADVTSATVEMSLLCIISKSKVYIKDEYHDLSDYVNQGMGYHDGMMYVPISGGSGWAHRSVIMVFNMDGVIEGSTIYPSEAVVFRVTSSSYAKQFEIESCDICSADGKLYFNTNRRKTSSDTNHDGVSWFKDYTFVKLTEPAYYHNFVVQYDANGGGGTMEDTLVPYGVSTKLRENTYTRAGCHFAGWTAYRTAKDQWYYTNGTDTGWYTKGNQPSGYDYYIYKDTQAVAKTSSVDADTVIMYAKWEPSTYTVRYDANGGTGTMADTTVTYGVNSTLRENTFTRQGYTFVGWTCYRTAQNQWRYANPDGTSSSWYTEGSQPEGYTLYIYKDGVNVSKTTAYDQDVAVMYAQWSPNTYTVTFKNEDGTVLQSGSVLAGTVPTPPADPTKAQNGCTVYTFAGWDKDVVSVIGDAEYTATYTEGISHSWAEATCDTVRTCTVCGLTDGGTLGHNYVGTTTDATCTEEGKIVYTCSGCGDSYTEAIGALGHNYERHVTPPTCSENGMINDVCTNCGDTVSESITAFGHSYGTTTNAPDCTTDGSITYTCGFCGDSYSETIAATGHSYVDGVCSACGEADPDYAKPVAKPTLSLVAPALNFEDEIYYNIYYSVSDVTDVVEMGLITFHSDISDGTIDTADAVVPGYIQSGSYYVSHTNGIPAKMLGDALYFKAYAKLSDGTYAYSSMAGYHAVAYAKDILANSSNDKMRSLVVAMLNHGAAAQIHFDYKADNLMNGFLTEEQKALVSDYRSDMVAGLTGVDASKVGIFAGTGGYSGIAPNVVFDGAFAINLYFTPAKTMDGDLKLYYWTLDDYNAVDTLTAENASGVVTATETSTAGRYVGAITDIAAKEIDQTVFFAAVYESNGAACCTGVFSYSLATYCQDRIANGSATMQDFSKATVVYGYCAKQYFA